MIQINPTSLVKYIDPDRDGRPQESTAVAARLMVCERVAECTRAKENLITAMDLLQGVPTVNAHRFADKETEMQCVERAFWKSFVEETGIKSVMSIKDRETLDEQLNQERKSWHQNGPAPLPPFTEPNLNAFIDTTFANIGGMIQSAIKEVFDWLRPWKSGHKTNDAWQIGDKVVLSYLSESDYRGGHRVPYQRQANLDALGNVLSMLDGKGCMKHPDNLTSKINRAWNESDVYEDDYIYAKCFKNQNAHIRFKRMDLVNQINATAGEMVLRERAKEQSRGFSH